MPSSETRECRPGLSALSLIFVSSIALIETATRLIITGDRQALAQLRVDFRYRPLNYFRSDAYQLFIMTDGEKGWDGYRYPLVLKADVGGEILRGRKDELLAFCEEHGYEVDTRRMLPLPYNELTVHDVTDNLIQAPFTLDDSQKKAIVAWLRHGIGVANMAVNSGKTATFASAAALIKRDYPDARFLYFTFSERLVKQVYAAMTSFLPDWHITQYGGGGHRDNTGKDMVVATQAMLNRNFKQLLKEGFFKTFMGLLMDESHHCQSPTAERVIRECPSYFRLGASDTTKKGDPDKWNRILGLCGPIRYTVTSSEMIEAGRSAAPTLYLVDVPSWKGKFRREEHEPKTNSCAWVLKDNAWHEGVYEGPVYKLDEHGDIEYTKRRTLVNNRWESVEIPVTVSGFHRVRFGSVVEEVPARYTILNRRYDNAVIMFEERNQMIVRWAKHFSDQGKTTLVVATRTPHVIILTSLLIAALGRRVRCLFGEDSSAKRDRTFAWLKEVPGRVLVTPLVKEGVSINELRAGVVADPVADHEVARQIIGRFMRKKEVDNTCEIVWFVDRQHPKLQANVAKLIEHLEQIKGFTFRYPVEGPETVENAHTYHAH